MIRRFHILSVSAIVLLAAAWLSALHAPDTARKAANFPSVLPSKIQHPSSDAALTLQETAPAALPAEEDSALLSIASSGSSESSIDEGQKASSEFVWDETKAIAVEPGAEGDTFFVQGQQVTVQSYQRTPQGNALAVVVKREEPLPTGSPVTQATELAVAELQTTETQSAIAQEAPRPARSRFTMGFTYEEELFRAKWGWNAYAQAQREAVLHPEATP